VSPLAIAFVVGYNIDIFFSLMDTGIKKIEKALTNSITSSNDSRKDDINKSNGNMDNSDE